MIGCVKPRTLGHLLCHRLRHVNINSVPLKLCGRTVIIISYGTSEGEEATDDSVLVYLIDKPYEASDH